jgi:hypothetical protein
MDDEVRDDVPMDDETVEVRDDVPEVRLLR